MKFSIISTFLTIASASPTSKSRSHSHQQKNTIENSVEMKNRKVLTQWYAEHSRNVQCPVCTVEDVLACPILKTDIDLSKCELPEKTGDCSCCPRCKSKEGEFCGQIVNDSLPGRSSGMQTCEDGLECSNSLFQGVCRVPQEYVDYTNDPMNWIEEYNLFDSINLSPGCNAHLEAVTTMEIYYPPALGVREWHPTCSSSDQTKYAPIQCRFKEQANQSHEEVCWCVDVHSGRTTLHMEMSKSEAHVDLCNLVADVSSDEMTVATGKGSTTKHKKSTN